MAGGVPILNSVPIILGFGLDPRPIPEGKLFPKSNPKMVIQKLLSGRPHCSKIDLRKEMPSL
jgi:hypothetical protein